jgi:hypothetical protein
MRLTVRVTLFCASPSLHSSVAVSLFSVLFSSFPFYSVLFVVFWGEERGELKERRREDLNIAIAEQVSRVGVSRWPCEMGREGAGTRLRRPMVTGSRAGAWASRWPGDSRNGGTGISKQTVFRALEGGRGVSLARVRNRGAENESGAILLAKTVPCEVPNTSFCRAHICQASLRHRGKH